jgi:hypothetical protein
MYNFHIMGMMNKTIRDSIRIDRDMERERERERQRQIDR